MIVLKVVLSSRQAALTDLALRLSSVFISNHVTWLHHLKFICIDLSLIRFRISALCFFPCLGFFSPFFCSLIRALVTRRCTCPWLEVVFLRILYSLSSSSSHFCSEKSSASLSPTTNSIIWSEKFSLPYLSNAIIRGWEACPSR